MNYRDEFTPLRCSPKGWLGRVAAVALVLTAISLAGMRIHAANLPPGFAEAVIPGPGGGGWNDAVGVTFSATGRMWVWERTGKLWIKDPGDTNYSMLLNISEEVGAWEDHGMLGFAYDPDFQVNGYIYLLYVVDRHHLMNFGTGGYNPNSNDYNSATIGRLTRYTCTSSNNFRSVNLASRLVLIGETKQTGFPILSYTHGIGSLAFSEDGMLLASCGDGATADTADQGGTVSGSYAPQGLADGIISAKENIGGLRSQLVDSLSGKIVRIDPDTGNGVPGNPFYQAGSPRSATSRVWTLGVRNPFRFGIKPETGSHNPADANPGVLFFGDVGWNTLECLRVVTAPKQNCGWPLFEGLSATGNGYDGNVANLDAPNPYYPTNSSAQFFRFSDLLKADTLVLAGQPPFDNPWNPALKIPSSIPQFLHTRPVLDWNHASATTRTPTYSGGGLAQTANVGAGGSPVSGTSFQGNCAVGGTWYTGTNFPAAYQDRYYFADWGQGLIKTLTFNTNHQPVALGDFASAAGYVASVAQHPLDGSLYYISYNFSGATMQRVTYAGNRTPYTVATANIQYGTTPLLVQLSSAGSGDPDGQPVSYSWNFGDGSPANTQPNPEHTFTAPPGVPTKFVVTLTVTDSGGLSSQATLNVSLNNTPPAVAITSPADGLLYSTTNPTLLNLTAAVSDTQSTDSQLSYQWQVLFHHNDHNHGSPPDTNHVTSAVIEPTACDGINLYYYRVRLTVSDPHGLSTVAEVRLFPACGNNTPPTISDITNQTTPVGTVTAAIPFTINDAQVAPANLQLSVTSSNLALVPLNNIVFGGSGSNRTVTLTPAPGLNGYSLITITVNDGPNNVSDSFLLAVGTNAPPPTTPVISDIPNQATTTNTPTAAIPFTISDPDTPVANLALSRNSSNTNLVPTNNIVFGGSSSNRTVTVTPANGLTGTSTITVTVSDGTNSANDTFLLTVTTVNTPPTISGITNQMVNEDNATGPVAFTIADAETAAGSLTLGKGSSDLTLVPTSNIMFGGSSSNRTVTVTPATNQSGSATITVTVGDGQYTVGTNFTITVNAVNDTPTITGIANQSIGVSSTTGPLNFTVGDVETAAASLTVSSNSSNPALVPDANIVLGGAGASRTVTVTPLAGQTGTAVITISVSDGALTASNTFNVTVSAQPAGLVAAYSFNEGSGTTAADVSGNTNHGIIGSATWITTGRYSNALDFNGTSARVTVNDSPSLDLTTNMTLEAWVYPTAGGGWRDVIYKGADDIYYLMGSSDTGAPAVGGTFSPSPLRGAAALPLNTWTHLAGTYDGTTMRLFTNGVQAASVAQTGAIQISTTALTIGGDALYGQYFTGSIDEVRVYNRALSVAEIQADMNTPLGATPSQPPTITSITNQITTVNTPKTGIAFTIGDTQTAASNLVLSATSANTTLVPSNNIVFGGSGANRTVTITPASNQLGSATITLIVSDGSLSASNSFVLTVNPATLVVTENSAIRSYGATNLPLTGSVTGLQAGDIITASFTSAATTNSSVGSYQIAVELSDPGSKLGNYIVTTNNGTLTVTNAPLTVTENSTSRTYGATNPPLTGSVSGLVAGDVVTAAFSTTATTNSPVGAYPITVTLSDPDSRLGNYTVTTNHGTLTVTQLALVVKANNTNKVYRTVLTFSGGEFSIINGALVNGNTLTNVSLSSPGTSKGAKVGTYPITASAAQGQGLANYSIVYSNGVLTIGPANLTIAAAPLNKPYGTSLTLTGTEFIASDLEPGDSVTNVTLNCDGGTVSTAAAGVYSVAPSNAEGLGLTNYTITYSNGTLTVGTTSLLVTTLDTNKVYGTTLNPTAFTIAGLLNSDTVTNVTLTSSGQATNAPVGSYPITAGGVAGSGLTNYTIGYSNGTMTVTQAVLVATADNQSRAYGQPNPPFTISYAGFMNGEGTNVLDVLPIASSSATSPSAPGNYVITAIGGSDNNYLVRTIDGTLMVTAPGPVTITFVTFIGPTSLRLKGTGDANVNYKVEASINLSDWTEIGTAVADGFGEFEFVDLSTAGFYTRYYRIAMP